MDGVRTSLNLHTPDYAEAAVDALRAVPGRFVFAYGNIQAGPWLHDYLPLLLTTAGQISAEWAIWLSRPHVEIARRTEPGSATA